MLRTFLAGVLTFLRESLTENIGLKALAMAFALGLFAFVHGQEEEQQRTVPVALVMRLPQEAAQRELMTPIPASIHVTLQGSARAIDMEKFLTNSPYLPSLEFLTRSRHKSSAMVRISSSVFSIIFKRGSVEP